MRESTEFKAKGLQELLTTQGRKARWLANATGVSESHMSRIVSGERRVSRPLAERIATTIQVPLFLAFEFTDKSKSSMNGEQQAA